MKHRYRVTLNNGTHWITAAVHNMDARRIAHRDCPDLQLFGVHIERVERLAP